MKAQLLMWESGAMAAFAITHIDMPLKSAEPVNWFAVSLFVFLSVAALFFHATLTKEPPHAAE